MPKRSKSNRFSRPSAAAGNPLPHRPRRKRWLIAAAVLTLCGVAIGVWALDRVQPTPIHRCEVVAEFPHDPAAYCQGLVVSDGVLYEGTGLYGQSSLRRVDLETGRTLQRVDLDPRLFGEGIAAWQDQIIQLTWKQGTGIVYQKSTLHEVGRFPYPGEGWGLTHDGENWIMSDGSPTLRFIDPQTRQVVRRVVVRSGGRRVRLLNELEFVKGEIWANIWYKDYIARISPRTGDVTGWIDLTGLYPARLRRSRDEVLNGIAYDAEEDRLFVTGKNWPKLFEIRLVPTP